MSDELVFQDTSTTFLKPGSMEVGHQLKLIYQGMEESEYGPFCVWCDLEGTKRFGLTTSGIKSAVSRNVIKPGDTCLLTYEGTQESDKKGFKPFHKFNIKVGRAPQASKPAVQPQVVNPNIEASKASWDNFQFEEV